ncbi:MAG: CheY-P-specific phosphatase CheC [Actinobacteria bacterium HGW-Actinobacteria-10]|nr:MAG: CheY-P-specific phosphatase CheC [Actinobacteria bacterium HGW-Actinobacteria-10]
MRADELTPIQLDALREVGNIGAGHAATALSQLTGSPITITNPTIELVPFAEVPLLMGGAERLVAAAYSRLFGDLAGGILFMADRDSSLALVDLMHSRPPGTTKSFGHSEEMLVSHVASILTSAYLAAIARMADVNLMPSGPSFALDMAGAILQVATIDAGTTADSALLVRARFADEQTSVDAMLFFLPDPTSLEVILGRLGMA